MGPDFIALVSDHTDRRNHPRNLLPETDLAFVRFVIGRWEASNAEAHRARFRRSSSDRFRSTPRISLRPSTSASILAIHDLSRGGSKGRPSSLQDGHFLCHRSSTGGDLVQEATHTLSEPWLTKRVDGTRRIKVIAI
jgi:hypothetical protein